MDPAARVGGGAGDGVEVAQRVELGLVVEADGAAGLERQLGEVGDGARRQPGPARGRRLALDRVATALRCRVCVVRLAPEVALDPELVDLARDPGEPGLVRLAVGARDLGAVAAFEPVVAETVQRAQLRRRVAGGAGADPPRLEQDDVGAGAGQLERRRDADDPAADDGDIAVDFADERGVTAGVGRARPVGEVVLGQWFRRALISSPLSISE